MEVDRSSGSGGDKYRIPFLVEGYIGDIVDFDDCAIVLVDVGEILLGSRSAVQPPNIAYGARHEREETKQKFQHRTSSPRVRLSQLP
jgi:hypothetical protein